MTQFEYFSQQLPIIGLITSVDTNKRIFTVKTRGREFLVHTQATTWYESVRNLDRIDRLRVPRVEQAGDAFLAYVEKGRLIAVDGVFHIHKDHERYDALTIKNLTSTAGYLHFEHTHWWVAQIRAMSNRWLDNLFGTKRTYSLDDYAELYRTNLNILGLPTDDNTQEMATLARLIYGFSSAYLLTGDERYYLAAAAGVQYQREAFRSISADGRFCVWLHARKRDRNGQYDVLPSECKDDRGALPLYEQIYALAGLSQFYRITNDWEVLFDIQRTIATFQRMFRDRDGKVDGFFSHIDPVTFKWNDPQLALTDNLARKNWNSIGDHLPAYLITLLLALDPLPQTAADGRKNVMAKLHLDCIDILETTARLIRDHFPQKDGNPYVCERFDREFNPYYEWNWQQNRAIVGHNLKIAWNLTRVANYFQARKNSSEAKTFSDVACKIGKSMASLGVDQIRSGVYDAVERKPADPAIPVQFAWLNTRDFWQQEQGILAYLILWGHLQVEDPNQEDAQKFLALARELCCYWNLNFLDHERTGVFFRISDNGTPVVKSEYGDKGGHSISGYHVFELAYLAHLYQRAYLPRQLRQHTVFCLHFRPTKNSGLSSINVLPDYLGPDSIEIDGVVVDGVERQIEDADRQNFQVALQEQDLGASIIVRFRQTKSTLDRLSSLAPGDNWLDVFEVVRPATD